MKALHVLYIAAADTGGTVLMKLTEMLSNIVLFACTNHQINPFQRSNGLRFQLGIAAGDYHRRFRILPLNPANQLFTFLVGIFSNRTGINDIHIRLFREFFFFVAFLIEEPRQRGRFGKVEFTTQGMKCYGLGWIQWCAKIGQSGFIRLFFCKKKGALGP